MFARAAALLVLLAFVGLPTTPAAEGVEGVRWVTQALAEAMSDFSPSSETNPQCNVHSALYRQGLVNSTLWAVQMLDASSLTVGGLLYGDMYHLGHFEQCLAVNVPESSLRGQHCLATLRYGPQPQLYTPPNATFHQTPLTASVWDKVKMTQHQYITRRDLFHWAVCVPASCSPQDLQISLNTTLDKVLKKRGLLGTVTVDPEFCHQTKDDEATLPEGYIVVKSIIWTLMLVAVIATTYDYVVLYYREEKLESAVAEITEKLLLAFSLRKNFNELTEKGANPKLDFMNGAKVFSMAGILFGHRALYSHGLALHNNEFWESRFENHFGDIALMNGTHLVDLFFLASGFLAFLGLYKALEASGSVNLALAIFLRWLRIVPPYLMMIAYVGWYLPYRSEGPLWDKRVGLEARRCQDNWWLNLLFINNYVRADNQCWLLSCYLVCDMQFFVVGFFAMYVLWRWRRIVYVLFAALLAAALAVPFICLLLSWYLACDMQFFVVGIFAMYVLCRWRRVGYVLFAALLAAALAVPFIVTYVGNYSGILKLYAPTLLNDPFSNDHFTTVYVKSHSRAAPYIIGAFTGFLCVKLSEANYKFSKKVILAGFVVLFWGGYAYQWYCYLFYQSDHPYNALENAFYAAFHRVSYPLGVAWVALTYYTTGYGLFRVMLAQPLYTPLSRLVYCLVLIHPVVQLAEAASVRHSESLNYQKMFWMSCGDYLVSTLFAVVLHLLVEAPSRTLVKILFLSRPSRTQKISPSQPSDHNGELKTPKQVIISKL